MDIYVSGKQVDVGDALREHIESKLREIDAKYASRAVDARVVISKDAHRFKCDCVAHFSSGLHATAVGEEAEPYAACDRALSRLEKQLRRFNRRLKDHHQRRKDPVAQIDGSAYVLRAVDDAVVSDAAEGDANGADLGAIEEQEEFWSPAIIAETKASVPSLSVGEAVMQMELAGVHFLLFVHDAHQRVNAVYRREDGNIGWIDPHFG